MHEERNPIIAAREQEFKVTWGVGFIHSMSRLKPGQNMWATMNVAVQPSLVQRVQYGGMLKLKTPGYFQLKYF